MAGHRSRLAVAGLMSAAALLVGCTVTVAGQPSPGAVSAALTTSSSPTSTRSTTTSTTSTTPVTSSSATSTRPSTTSPADLRRDNDATADLVLTRMAAALETGDRKGFVAPFDPKLAQQAGKWFDNTHRIGVRRAELIAYNDEKPPVPDTSRKFSRLVGVGVQTPFDASGSLPAIAYAATFAKSGTAWRISGWAPKYLSDPLWCDCVLSVTKSANGVVVGDAGDERLADRPKQVSTMMAVADTWMAKQLKGTTLLPLKGHVVFLAPEPNRWFQSLTGTQHEANITAVLYNAAGPDPYQSRVVLLFSDSEGNLLPQNKGARAYLQAVVVHEFGHQLMLANADINRQDPDAQIDPWVSEGIATALEVRFHRADPNQAANYELADDPRNIDPDWLAVHYKGAMATGSQLYRSSSEESSNWYALSGSVFLYVAEKYGMPAMLTLGRQLYAQGRQSPFEYFPDPAKKGKYLSAATARARWQDWVKQTYLS